eukprot:6179091-Pleurochrysis_carterae.AAC.1
MLSKLHAILGGDAMHCQGRKHARHGPSATFGGSRRRGRKRPRYPFPRVVLINSLLLSTAEMELGEGASEPYFPQRHERGREAEDEVDAEDAREQRSCAIANRRRAVACNRTPERARARG